jgi:hypothetical protein
MRTAQFLLGTAAMLSAMGVVLPATLGGCGESTSNADAIDASPEGGEAKADGSGARADAATAERFCDKATHSFCADFDGEDPNAGWDQVDPSIDEVETADSDQSPPHALFIHGPGGTTGWGASLLVTIKKTVSSIHYACDVRIDPARRRTSA